MEIRYAVEATRPPTSFTLTIPASGDAELLLLQPLASASSPLGRFRGPLAAGRREDLRRFVQDHDLLDAAPGDGVTSEGSGSISLATPEGRITLGLASDVPAHNALRAKLDELVRALLKHPVGAFRTELRAESTADGLVPVVSLVHVGSEPLALVLVDENMVASLVVTVTSPTGVVRELVSKAEDIHAPPGITALSPGQKIDVWMGSVVEAGSHVSVRGTCWYPEGRARRAVALLAEGDLK
ncbi:MAG: hypothetical protein KC776_17295 [Myxococcales bacterium]|nr:hypothetical protein [Myxococcales bacterium]MCB9580276.1 hypothetical protein [Polyangiaceae bacterium]